MKLFLPTLSFKASKVEDLSLAPFWKERVGVALTLWQRSTCLICTVLEWLGPTQLQPLTKTMPSYNFLPSPDRNQSGPSLRHQK